MRILLIYIVTHFYFIVSAQSKKITNPDKYIKEKMKEYKIPGLGLLVVQKGKVIKESYYGISNLEFEIPVTKKSVFQLASATKIFTSTLIMKLCEEGLINLDSSVNAYIDGLPESFSAVKVRHLLSHTHGIPNIYSLPAWHSMQEEERDTMCAEQILRLCAAYPPDFKPGEKFSYNQTGYIVLGVIVEKVTGKKIETIMKERIFSPLEMTTATYGDHRIVTKNRSANLYTYQRGSLENWPFMYGPKRNGSATTAAGLNMTIPDLAKWLIALDKEQILKRKSIDDMTDSFVFQGGKKSGYGLGWSKYKVPGIERDISGHEGGSCAWIYYVREENLLIAVLCNLTGSHADEIIDGLTKFYINNYR